jgi:hypothetical protein
VLTFTSSHQQRLEGDEHGNCVPQAWQIFCFGGVAGESESGFCEFILMTSF